MPDFLYSSTDCCLDSGACLGALAMISTFHPFRNLIGKRNCKCQPIWGRFRFTSKLREELGWCPAHADFEKGLLETIRWYRDNVYAVA